MSNSNTEQALFALYGHQSKHLCYAKATEFAKKLQLDFTIIDFDVVLSKPRYTQRLKPDDLSYYEFISTNRMTKATIQQLERSLQETNSDFSDNDSLISYLASEPDKAANLLNHPKLRHIRVFNYQGKTLFHDNPVNIGIIPQRHYKYIQNPVCRFYSHIKVTV
ncbi:hypothetical protein KCM76_22160 [Zooshikella marina]|uniref:hypothetical protein n=1 Tax=Zooshikella ganghwensis TaxID=202772 RepID=UPI001BB0A3B2|nr:hypothetical protein [Zooshikella ganghwensis]MBU2708713.1 hypothetical protein [Zooshikella ganghwensis]